MVYSRNIFRWMSSHCLKGVSSINLLIPWLCAHTGLRCGSTYAKKRSYRRQVGIPYLVRVTIRFHEFLTCSVSVKNYPHKNVNELWLIKKELLSVGGSMVCHVCIASVGFESSYGLFLYHVKWNECSLIMMLMRMLV